MLRPYHETIGELIPAYGGTLEHFAGDGIMVFFNDPVAVDEHELAAIRLALAAQERFEELAADRRKRGTELGSGSGSGRLRDGAASASRGHDYAALGSVANLASRLSTARVGRSDSIGPRVVRGRRGDGPHRARRGRRAEGFGKPVVGSTPRRAALLDRRTARPYGRSPPHRFDTDPGPPARSLAVRPTVLASRGRGRSRTTDSRPARDDRRGRDHRRGRGRAGDLVRRARVRRRLPRRLHRRRHQPVPRGGRADPRDPRLAERLPRGGRRPAAGGGRRPRDRRRDDRGHRVREHRASLPHRRRRDPGRHGPVRGRVPGARDVPFGQPAPVRAGPGRRRIHRGHRMAAPQERHLRLLGRVAVPHADRRPVPWRAAEAVGPGVRVRRDPPRRDATREDAAGDPGGPRDRSWCCSRSGWW